MINRHAIFCKHPLEPRSVEPDFECERRAAEGAGFEIALIDHDALDHRIDVDEALRSARFTEPGVAVYRGWMLRAEAYAALHAGLADRGVRLLTEPAAYTACHHAPGSYERLRDFMPPAVWVDAAKLDDPASISAALSRFGDGGVIIKDWVKSQAAGYWREACYIPCASDLPQARGVIARFRELQAESLVGGIIFKTYVPLLPVGQPAYETRAFFVAGRVVGCWPRSTVADRHSATPPPDLLQRVAASVPSPFVSADFAIDIHEKWWLLEVGDGQVSGLPEAAAAEPLFHELARLVAA